MGLKFNRFLYYNIFCPRKRDENCFNIFLYYSTLHNTLFLVFLENKLFSFLFNIYNTFFCKGKKYFFAQEVLGIVYQNVL